MTDDRFAALKQLAEDETSPEAGPSKPRKSDAEISDNDEGEGSDEEGEEVGEEDDGGDDDDGMDPEGFSAPKDSKIVKPITPEALAAFNAAQERTGIIYISRIPPGMRPTKVRHLMNAFGEVGRVYLQQEGASQYPMNHLES